MDNDNFQTRALRELRHIKWLAAATVAMLLVSAVALIAGALFLGSAAQKLVKDTAFQEMAEELFEKGRFDELRSVASARLKDRPNDLYAHLYTGKLHLQAKEWNEAVRSFEKIQALEPSWAEFVKPYLARAREGDQIRDK